MRCAGCGGKGCDACGFIGHDRVTRCPRKLVGPEVFDLLADAELYRKGIPPVAGGSLDQCRGFTEACRLAWSEHDYWKAKSGAPLLGLLT